MIAHKYLYPNIESQISIKSKQVLYYVGKQKKKMMLDKAYSAPGWIIEHGLFL